MKKRWTSEQLVETFTLTEAERQHLSGMVSHNPLLSPNEASPNTTDLPPSKSCAT